MVNSQYINEKIENFLNKIIDPINVKAIHTTLLSDAVDPHDQSTSTHLKVDIVDKQNSNHSFKIKVRGEWSEKAFRYSFFLREAGAYYNGLCAFTIFNSFVNTYNYKKGDKNKIDYTIFFVFDDELKAGSITIMLPLNEQSTWQLGEPIDEHIQLIIFKDEINLVYLHLKESFIDRTIKTVDELIESYIEEYERFDTLEHAFLKMFLMFLYRHNKEFLLSLLPEFKGFETSTNHLNASYIRDSIDMFFE